MKSLKLQGGTALVIVAHPDDETIWMGGTILSYPKVRWTIVALCRASDLDRAPKYQSAVKVYGAKGIIFDLEDEGKLNITQSIPKITALVKRAAGTRQFEYVFTHGANGEYGHPRHKAVHRAVKAMLKRNALRAEQVYAFSYKPSERGRFIAVPDSTRATHGLRLTPQVARAKRNIVVLRYGFSRSSFEARSCAAIETFRRFS